MIFQYENIEKLQKIISQIADETFEVDENIVYSSIILWKSTFNLLKILEKYYGENSDKENNRPNIQVNDQNLVHVLTFRNVFPTKTTNLNQMIVFEFEFSKLDEMKSFLFSNHIGTVSNFSIMRSAWRKAKALLKFIS